MRAKTYCGWFIHSMKRSKAESLCNFDASEKVRREFITVYESKTFMQLCSINQKVE